MNADDPGKKPVLQVLLPAYFYPAAGGLKHWENLLTAAGMIPITAIVNPASGPGKAVDPNYTKVVQQAAKAGVRLVGYVSTRYGKRSLADVRADMTLWLKFHPELQGFFLDEQASSPEFVDHYVALYEHARKTVKEAFVVTNPGTLCSREFFTRPAADLICLFENEKGFDGFTRPAWSEKLPADRFAALPHTAAGAERMRSLIRQAVEKKFGFAYVTDAGLPNPWDRLPTYWDDEVAAIAAANAGK
jgi:hypothetical protein